MKICTAICEYNPFHNGHLKHIEFCKEKLGCDTLIVLMSGNFTERGDIAILDKYERATLAIKNGADIVIELPTVIAVQNAEIFAKGAVKILTKIRGNNYLAFASESGNESDFLETAKLLSDEPTIYKQYLKAYLDKGEPLAYAKQKALEDYSAFFNIGVDYTLLTSPNNILGLEYTKAILSQDSRLKIATFKRLGAGFNDENLSDDNFSSARAIRKGISENNIESLKNSMPNNAYEKIKDITVPNIDDLLLYSLISKTKEEISAIQDCSEGLENRIVAKLKTSLTFEDFLESVATKRYPLTRIKRIALNSLLGITKKDIEIALRIIPYYRILAINKDRLEILNLLKYSRCRMITNIGSLKGLTSAEKHLLDIDIRANDIYNLVTKKKTNDYQMLKI